MRKMHGGYKQVQSEACQDMKGCLKPLTRRQVVNNADKAYGPRKEVADLKLPNEPKMKEGGRG